MVDTTPYPARVWKNGDTFTPSDATRIEAELQAGKVLDVSSEASRELARRFAPAAGASIGNAAPLIVDFTAQKATKYGTAAPYSAAVTETAAYQRDVSGCLVWQRGTTNLLPNPTLSGGALGVTTSGTGVWPTGWVITTSASGTLVYEILYLANNTMRVRATRAANTTALSGSFGIRHPNTPGVSLPVASRGGYAISSSIGIIGTPTPNVRNIKAVQTIRTTSTSALVAEPNVVLVPGTGVRRVSTFYPVAAGQSVSFGVNIELTGPTTDAVDVTFEVGMVQIEDAANAFDTTTFTPGARLDGAVVLPLAAGDYSLLLQGPRGGTWRDVTVTGTAGYTLHPPTTGSAPVAKIYAYTRQTYDAKNQITQAVDPVVYVDPRFYQIQGDRLWAGRRLHYRATPNTPYALAIAANRANEQRFELRPGDQTENASNTNQRSELVRTAWGTEVITAAFETEYWTSYALWIEDLPNDRDWTILGQWHQTEDANEGPFSPLLHLNYTKSGEMQIVCRSSSAAPTTQASIITTIPYREPAYPRGRWVNWVMAVTFSKTGGGNLRAFRDGVTVFDGPVPVGYNDTVGPYFQYGIYAPVSTTSTTVVRWANVEVEATSLVDRVANPLPVAGTLPAPNSPAPVRPADPNGGIVLLPQNDYNLLTAAERAAGTYGVVD